MKLLAKIGSWKNELKDKAGELITYVAIGLLRWLLEKLLENPGPGGDDAASGESGG